MRKTIHKTLAMLVAIAAMVSLVRAVRNPVWFSNPPGEDSDTVETVGLWTYDEIEHGEHHAMSLHARADAPGLSEDDAHDRSILWVAGIAVIGTTSLSIFALAFCLVSAVKRTWLEKHVSPRGLATIALIANLIAVTIFFTHVPFEKPTAVVWTYLSACVAGIVASEMLSRLFHRDEVAIALPIATVASR